MGLLAGAENLIQLCEAVILKAEFLFHLSYSFLRGGPNQVRLEKR